MSASKFILICSIFILLTGCFSNLNTSNLHKRHKYNVLHSAHGYKARGTASWYGGKFHHKRTSDGKRYNMYALTAAHNTLPLHSYVKVKNLYNDKVVVVYITDRGPFRHNRLIDLSYAAAQKIGMLFHGTVPVEIEAINVG